MNKSDSVANLTKALVAFQAEIENPKNTADNPYFKSKYAPLQDVLNIVRPLLAKHGLCVIQSPSGDGKSIVITTILMHTSGEWIESDPLVLQAEKATAQGAGSAITYGRRYALSALLGISSEDDDDGNHASTSSNKSKQEKMSISKTEQTNPSGQPNSASAKAKESTVNWAAFWAGCKDMGYTKDEVHFIAKEDNISHYTREQVIALYKQLQEMKKAKAAAETGQLFPGDPGVQMGA
jgi:hypothetical protein